MTTSAVSAILSGSSSANFNAWVQEIYTALVTTCGLLQTQDTGQSSASFAGGLPGGTGTANATGNYVFSFTDPLAGGALATLGITTAGSGYPNSAVYNSSAPLTATGVKSGATCTVNCTVSGGGVPGAMTLIAAGTGNFFVGEALTFSGTSTAGSGSHAFTTAGTVVVAEPLTLSSGSPICFQLFFGGGSAAASPQMWIVVGAGLTGTAGNTTVAIAGTAATSRMTEVACFTGQPASSLTTAYNSYYCVNMLTNFGYVGMAKSLGSGTLSTQVVGGFALFRSNDTAGHANGTAAVLITNSNTTTGVANSSSTGNYMQCMTYSGGAGSTIYPTLGVVSQVWPAWGNVAPFEVSTTVQGGIALVFPAYIMTPQIQFTAFFGAAVIVDLPLGNTVSTAIIGATALTFMSIGGGFGSDVVGIVTNATLTFLMLWQ